MTKRSSPLPRTEAPFTKHGKQWTSTSPFLVIPGPEVHFRIATSSATRWSDPGLTTSRISGTYNAHLRFDHTDHCQIELEHVPHRTNVLIDVGNEPDKTKGCVLVWMELRRDLCSLRRSREAYSALKERFYGSKNSGSTPDRSITVTIVDAGDRYSGSYALEHRRAPRSTADRSYALRFT